MISVEEARARILAPLRPVGAEVVGLAEAAGRVLALAVVARVTQPPADMSAMDGYAVRSGDVQPGATLSVVGAAPAGQPFEHGIGHGQAVRLFTGSVLPGGADAVVPQEAVQPANGNTVRLGGTVAPGAHIRRRGQDFAAGDVLLHAGLRLGARAVGLAAAGGHAWLTVHRRPRVAILATGNEIALPGEPLAAGGIVSSNAHALAALARAAGADPMLLPIMPDDVGQISAAIRTVAADLLLTTGGASVGDHDLIQAALAECGFELDFWQVAMRPGKPLLHGRLGGMPVLGLPGNPVSAFACAVLFALPALARLSGLANVDLPLEDAVLGAEVGANDHRADHLRATLHRSDGRLVATPLRRQDSSLLTVLFQADALVFRPPHAPALPVGATVPVLRLDTLVPQGV